MQLTKTQRKEIYELALQLYRDYYWPYLCTCIAKAANMRFTMDVTKQDFPEFFAQKPTVTYNNTIWWPREDKTVRINALEKAIELCN